jgi:hypothetical protein
MLMTFSYLNFLKFPSTGDLELLTLKLLPIEGFFAHFDLAILNQLQ